jgi:hypothetical protein
MWDGVSLTPDQQLFKAARFGIMADAIAAFDAGADVNARTPKDDTPLHWASGNGWADLVQLFKEKGADLEAKNNEGDRPLHRAARNGRRQAAGLLIAYGADPSARDNRGWAPLDYARNCRFKPTDPVQIGRHTMDGRTEFVELFANAVECKQRIHTETLERNRSRKAKTREH